MILLNQVRNSKLETFESDEDSDDSEDSGKRSRRSVHNNINKTTNAPKNQIQNHDVEDPNLDVRQKTT